MVSQLCANLRRRRYSSSNSAAPVAERATKRRAEGEGRKSPAKREKPEDWDVYPARLYTFIGQRYFVVKKAGEGVFATVWLCWDVESRRFVALKIWRCALHFVEDAADEIAIFEHLRSQRQVHAGIVELYTHFRLKRGNETYVCLVFEAMGRDIYQLQRRRGPFSSADVQKVTRVVLEALKTLHDVGIVHTDVKPENVLIGMSEEEEEALAYRALDGLKERPELAAHVRIIRDHIRGLRKRDAVIKLADLGSAQFADDLDHRGTICTQPYRSYEALLGDTWTEKTDIWSVACMAYELATGKVLMNVDDRDDRAHLMWMIARLGMPPLELRLRGSRARQHFHADGERVDPKSLGNISISAVKIVDSSRNRFDMNAAEDFVSFLDRLLVFDWRSRPSARRSLEHRFMSARYGRCSEFADCQRRTRSRSRDCEQRRRDRSRKPRFQRTNCEISGRRR